MLTTPDALLSTTGIADGARASLQPIRPVAPLAATTQNRRPAASAHEEADKLALEMRDICERCDTALALDQAGAVICSYECTFCQACSDEMSAICPNCGGELLARPRRLPRAG